MPRLIDELDAEPPNAKEAELARSSCRTLSRLSDRKELHVRTELGEEIILPASAVRLLVKLLTAMSEGKAVTLIPINAELTTQQAADLLGVSRPFFIRQMVGQPGGTIPFRMVGTHRRVLLADVLKYKQEADAETQRALAELARQAQDLDLGY